MNVLLGEVRNMNKIVSKFCPPMCKYSRLNSNYDEEEDLDRAQEKEVTAVDNQATMPRRAEPYLLAFLLILVVLLFGLYVNMKNDFKTLNDDVKQQRMDVQKMKQELGSLISIVENLRENVKSLHNFTTLRTNELRGILRGILSTGNLTRKLSNLDNFTTSPVSPLWRNVNNTKENIIKIFKMMLHQNSSLHSKARETFDVLSIVEKKINERLDGLQNLTNRNERGLRKQLEDTKDNIRLARKELAQWNGSLRQMVKETTHSFRSSLDKANRKVETLKKDVESNKNDVAEQQTEITEKFSKTKGEFQELKEELKKDTSGLETRLLSRQNYLEQSQKSLQTDNSNIRKRLEELEDTFDHWKNKANRCLQAQTHFVITFTFALSSLFIWN